MMLLHRLFDSYRLRVAGELRSTSQAGFGRLLSRLLSRKHFRRVRLSIPLNRPTPDGILRRRLTLAATPRTRSGDWNYLPRLRSLVSPARLSIGVRAGIYIRRFEGVR